jgi:hypothetical protein
MLKALIGPALLFLSLLSLPTFAMSIHIKFTQCGKQFGRVIELPPGKISSDRIFRQVQEGLGEEKMKKLPLERAFWQEMAFSLQKISDTLDVAKTAVCLDLCPKIQECSAHPCKCQAITENGFCEETYRRVALKKNGFPDEAMLLPKFTISADLLFSTFALYRVSVKPEVFVKNLAIFAPPVTLPIWQNVAACYNSLPANAEDVTIHFDEKERIKALISLPPYDKEKLLWNELPIDICYKEKE